MEALNIVYNGGESPIPEGIERLKGIKNLYMHGTGTYADRCYNTLFQYGINLRGIIAGGKYITDGLFHGIKVNAADQFYQALSEPISVIAGFGYCRYQELITEITRNKYVEQLIVLEGSSVLYENGFLFPQDEKIVFIDNYYNGVYKRKLTFDYFCSNRELFEETYHWLCDEKSRETMRLYLDGHINISEFPLKPVWNLEDAKKQYFPDDVVKLSDNEVFVDCGAYTGDTLSTFLKLVNSFSHYYALEPDKRRFEELESKVIDKRIDVLHKGAWSEKAEVYFSDAEDCGEVTNDETKIRVPVDSIDSIVKGYPIERVSFIKMDIEGAELEALKGAANTIMKDRPQLAICVYHKREDLIDIPYYIKKLRPDYDLYLRAHYPYVSELVLYAV